MPLTPLLLFTVLLVMMLIAKHKYILKEPHYKNLTEGHLELGKHKDFSTRLASHLETVVGTKAY